MLLNLVLANGFILALVGGGGPIMGDLWALKGLIEEG